MKGPLISRQTGRLTPLTLQGVMRELLRKGCDGGAFLSFYLYYLL